MLVYQMDENTLTCFSNNAHYWGFLNDTEKELDKNPVYFNKEILYTGDRIVGFDSGVERTSFLLDYDYMTFRGGKFPFLFFEIYDSKTPIQQSLFEQRPCWYLAFAWFPEVFRFYMFSSFESSYDIVPNQIIRYNSPVGHN